MPTATNFACWVDLSGPAVTSGAIDVPPHHRGLTWAAMMDLGAAQQPPVPGLVGKGLWRVFDEAMPKTEIGEQLSAPVFVPDAEARTVTRSWNVERLPDAEFRAAWAAERDALIGNMKAAAEAACEAYLSPGRTKAMRYDEKKREVLLWAATASPRNLDDYPMARAEAAARAGLNPFDPTDLATVTEAQVDPVMASYTANAVPWIAIGSGIEAQEQAAGDAIAKQHDLAIAAYDADPAADLTAFLAAMRAAALPAFPSPA